MTSPLRSPGASSPISKRQRRSSSGLAHKSGGASAHGGVKGAAASAKVALPSSNEAVDALVADQVMLGPPSTSPNGQRKTEIMKDGGFTPVMSKEEKRKEKKRLKEEQHRKVGQLRAF